MKKLKIVKQDSLVQTAIFDSDKGLEEFVKLLETQHPWGKPERWVLHKDEPMAESYDDADVLEEMIEEIHPAVEAVLDDQGVEVSPAIPAVTQKKVKLKAEYTVEIIDLEQDPAWLLEQCHAKRKMEYPDLGEFADAFVKLQGGDSSQMDAYVAACLAVKAKYPKP